VLGEGLQSNAVIIRGVLGEDTVVPWFGVSLVMVTRMDMCLCVFELIFSWRYQEGPNE